MKLIGSLGGPDIEFLSTGALIADERKLHPEGRANENIGINLQEKSLKKSHMGRTRYSNSHCTSSHLTSSWIC